MYFDRKLTSLKLLIGGKNVVDKLISIIIPVYKAELYLDRCLESVVNQTYKNLEIILVDDGSPDNCPKMCDEWAKKDKRIKVIHKTNGGVSKARNEGLKIATGEYVQFVDSDDYLSLTFCEDLSKAYTDDVDLVISGFTMVYDDKEVETSIKIDHALNIKENIDVFFKSLGLGMIYPPWNKLFRRELIKCNFPEGVALGEDRCFVLDYLMHAKKSIRVIDASGYMYIQYPGSAFHRARNDILEIYSTFLNKMQTFLDKVFSTHHHNNYYQCIFDVIVEAILKSSKDNIKKLKTQVFDYQYFDEMKANYKPTGFKEKLKLFLIKHKMFNTLRWMSKIKNR